MDLYDIRKELNRGKSINDLNLRVTFYARVSTGSDEQENSLQNQISYYEDFIKSNSNWTYVHGYIDKGISGKSVDNRTAFLKMIKDAKHNRFDFIITKEISRFSRNTLDSIKYIQELLENNIGVLFQYDNINTLLPDSELRLTIMSSMAQEELRRISERVKFGLNRSIDKGIVLGSNNIHGYDKKNGVLYINEEEAEFVRLIFNLYANSDIGLRNLADEVNKRGYRNRNNDLIHTGLIRRIITNHKYKGYYCGRKTIKIDYRSNKKKNIPEDEWVIYKDDNIPALVSEEIWNIANKKLNERGNAVKEKRTSYNNTYKYSSKIICIEHNTAYCRHMKKYSGEPVEVWRCRAYHNKGIQGCNTAILYTRELDDIIIHFYDIFIGNKDNIINEMMAVYDKLKSSNNNDKQLKKLDKSIETYRKNKKKLYDLYFTGIIGDNEFKAENDEINNKLTDYEREKLKLLDSMNMNNIQNSKREIKEFLVKQLSFKDGITYDMVHNVIEKIIVDKLTENKVQIDIYFKLTSTSNNYFNMGNEEFIFIRTRRGKEYEYTYNVNVHITT